MTDKMRTLDTSTLDEVAKFWVGQFLQRAGERLFLPMKSAANRNG